MPTTGQYCPKDSKPIIEDQSNCTFQIHNDTTAVQNLLKMVANWDYKSIQDINILIIKHGNDTEDASHHRIGLHEWIMTDIDPDRPLYFISWRTDFNVLSFGLLNEVHSNPGFTLAIDETTGACKYEYGSESTIREIVRTISNYIRESKLLYKTYEYENINMCFLSVFEWFKNSPWYHMKKYFGVPFQEFGYKCCKLYNQTVCCNDKLYNFNGYRLIPYIISVLLICYVPILLLKVATINHTFHPNYYHDFDDNSSGNGSQQDQSLMSMFDNIFCINTKSNESNEKITICIEIINWIKLRVCRLLFVFLLPCAIYLEFIMFSLSKDWKAKLNDIETENVLFGFTIMLADKCNKTFLYPFGPLTILILYHAIGICILVLPKNFEENVVKEGIINTIFNTILEELSQQGHKNLPGYIQLERVLTSCMFMVFNSKFWTRCMLKVFNCIKSKYKCMCKVFECIRSIICCYNMHQLCSCNGNFKTIACKVFNYICGIIYKVLREILLIFIPVLALPVIPFTIIIVIGYKRFASSKVYCKCLSCTCNNKKNECAEQNQTMNENTHLIRGNALKTQPKVENNKDKGAKRNQHTEEIHETTEQNQAIDVNNKKIGAEQKQTTDENTKDLDADKCDCTCKTIMEGVYGVCSLLLMVLFVYLVAVIVSYTVYIIVYALYFMWWALVTSPTETSGFLIFFSGGIVFVFKIVKYGISFYKELFNLTIEVCQQNEDCTKNKYIKLQNGIIYIKKDIVRTVQQAIYPFYISIGYTIMKLIAMMLLYISHVLVIKKYLLNTGTTGSDYFIQVTMLITSALPSLVASHFKHKLPNENIVKHIVHCYVEKAGSSNVNLQNGQVLQSPSPPDHISEEEETGLKTLTTVM